MSLKIFDDASWHFQLILGDESNPLDLDSLMFTKKLKSDNTNELLNFNSFYTKHNATYI